MVSPTLILPRKARGEETESTSSPEKYGEKTIDRFYFSPALSGGD